MNRKQAIKMDKTFYSDFDDESGLYCVFGDNSGFAYHSFASSNEAMDKAIEMDNAKK